MLNLGEKKYFSTPKRFIVCISVLWFALSCETINQENINTFIESKKCWDKPNSLVKVNLGIRHDSLRIEIADTYPNIKAEKFRFDTILSGSRVIFTGEKIKGFSKKTTRSHFPPDIVSALKMNPDLRYEEFTAWVYL